MGDKSKNKDLKQQWEKGMGSIERKARQARKEERGTRQGQ
jgi:hypothetical protein